MDPSESRPGGLFASVRRLGDSVLSLLHVRLELVAVELQEEKLRLFDLLLRVAAFVVLGVMALLSATAFIVVVFWRFSPVLTLGAITALYLIAALAIWSDLKKRISAAPLPFTDTLAELKKDAECFQDKK